MNGELPFPNRQILRALYENYYGYAGDEPRPGGEHVSSHWQVYSQDSMIEWGQNGQVVGYKNAGFGEYRDDRLLKRLADYMCYVGHYLFCKEKIEVARLTKIAMALLNRIPFQGHYLSYDMTRQIHSLAAICRAFDARDEKPFTVVVIGDGFGFLTAMAKTLWPQASFVLVDIGRTLFFQSLYLGHLFPLAKHDIAMDNAGSVSDRIRSDFLYCPAEYLEGLRDFSFRLAVNICSMQEMTMREIQRYFQFLRAHVENGALFYCCNRETKTLPDGEVVSFESYPWSSSDKHLFEGRPHVHNYWLSMRKNRNRQKWHGVVIPLLDGPDGPIRHRLTVLNSYK